MEDPQARAPLAFFLNFWRTFRPFLNGIPGSTFP